MSYSGGGLDDMETIAITGEPMTAKRIQAGTTGTLDGIKLTYINGAKCEAT